MLLTIHLSANVYAHERDSIRYDLNFDDIVVGTQNNIPNIIPTQKLAGDELERLSAHSVADAIRYFSGVQIKDYGGIGGLKSVNIRSMGSQHVGVFYDGVELGNAQNGVVDLGKFSLDNMESISLYNGQKSSIFQPAKDYASAGSIYMQSRTPRFEEGKNYNAIGKFKTGSFDLINPSILYEHKLSERVSASLNAEYMYTSGRYKFTYEKEDGYSVTDTRENGDVEYFRVEGGLFGTIDGGVWRAKLYYYDSERGYPGAYVREIPGIFKNADRQWDSNFFAQGSLTKSFSPHYSILVSGKYAYDFLHYLSDPREDVTTMYFDNSYTQQEGYLSIANNVILNDWWSGNVSVDYLYNTLDADLSGFVYPRRNTLLAALATSIALPKVKLQGSLLYTFVSESTTTSATSADDRDEWTPTVVLSYRPLERVDLDFRAFYKRIFRMPTLNDLYYDFIGNKDLDPEYTNQYNIGVSYNISWFDGALRNFTIECDAYYNEVENKIIAMPTSNQFRWTMLNLGNCEIRGVDIATELGWQISAVEINTRMNYTYQKAQDFTDPQSSYYGDQIPYIPWHSGSVILSAIYGTWDFNYSYIYTGERYEMQANIPENYMQPWYTHDMSISKYFHLKRCTLRASGEVNNIFNQQYEVVQCYPMPGTNFKFTFSVTM